MAVKVSRREYILYSVNAMVLADAALSAPDGRTIVNSILGVSQLLCILEADRHWRELWLCCLQAYGLPQVKGTTGFRINDDPNAEWVVE